MVTVHGAKATFFADSIGSLEIGKRADVVLIKFPEILEHSVSKETDILYLLISGMKGNHVDTVIVDGEILYKDGHHRKVNKDEMEAQLFGSINGTFQSADPAKKSLAKELRPYIVNFYKRWMEKEGGPSHENVKGIGYTG